MSQKLLAISGSVLVVAIILLSIIFLKKRNTTTMDALKAVPVDAALVFETNDFEGFIHNINKENKIWKELMSFRVIEKIDRNILFLV